MPSADAGDGDPTAVVAGGEPVDPLDVALAAVRGGDGPSVEVRTPGVRAGDGPGPLVVDVGGGSGTSAVPLAARGCRVVVVDSSIDALAILRRRAAEAGVASRIDGIQGDAERVSALVPPASADLVLCHHLLEALDDPAAAVQAMAAVLRPGGVLSVLAAGRYGAVLTQIRAGRAAEARAVLSDPDGRFSGRDPLRRRFDLDGLSALFGQAGLQVERATGIGLGAADPALDAKLGRHPVFRALGNELHVLGRRPR